MEERLQKILSQAGVCARRTAEKFILAGRVTVNGIPASLGQKAELSRDVVLVDGQPIQKPIQKTYIMLNKPRGYVTTLSDEKGRKSVADLVKGCGIRVWPVGRLDLDSEGLLLMTNDGALTHRLIHPSHAVEKEYLTWVRGDVMTAIPILTAPMKLDGEFVLPAQVKIVRQTEEKTVLSMIIHQGKYRQIRRMCAQAGLKVLRLKRVREGEIRLDQALRLSQWRFLTRTETLQLGVESDVQEKKM